MKETQAYSLTLTGIDTPYEYSDYRLTETIRLELSGKQAQAISRVLVWTVKLISIDWMTTGDDIATLRLIECKNYRRTRLSSKSL
jgi:hypothetical protein